MTMLAPSLAAILPWGADSDEAARSPVAPLAARESGASLCGDGQGPL
jgi:hypothetical protein